jgi:hypothetical protein
MRALNCWLLNHAAIFFRWPAIGRPCSRIADCPQPAFRLLTSARREGFRSFIHEFDAVASLTQLGCPLDVVLTVLWPARQ